jgi:hypothetical protein
MTTSIRSISIIAIFAAAAIVPVASAGASVNEPVLAGYYSAAPADPSSDYTSLTAISHDSSPTVASSDNTSLTALSHDSSPAALGSPVSSSLTAISHDSSPNVALRRDNSQAEAFVANVGPEPSTASGDGFDWGDASIGAGVVVLLACLAIAAAVGLNGRRGRTAQPSTAASQSA